MRKIAALFVETNGPYFGVENVDPWDVLRDARNYKGPHPVVAHPPCERWGRYWSGGPNPKAQRKKLGDDGGCFLSALNAVQKFGGVIEHPEASHAFRVYGLGKPPKAGGWVKSQDGIGWVCCVEQGHYGHPARKATWLYYVGKEKPFELKWGPSEGARMDEGFHTSEERKAARAAGLKPAERLSKMQRLLTPKGFMRLLLSLAETS